MKIHGKINEIIIDGYERLIHIEVSGMNKQLWCHLIQHEEFLEAGEQSKYLSVGQSITLEVGIDLVTDYSVLDTVSTVAEPLVQPIMGSSHVLAVATVMEIEDDYTLICEIEEIGSHILVEFEEKVDVEKGAVLNLKGNLKAELD